MDKEHEIQAGLTEKLMAMAAACAANLPKREVKEYPRFNNLRTANSYGEFTWNFKREKGRLTAVISRKGRLYCRLSLPAGCSRNARDDIVEYLQEQLCIEATANERSAP